LPDLAIDEGLSGGRTPGSNEKDNGGGRTAREAELNKLPEKGYLQHSTTKKPERGTLEEREERIIRERGGKEKESKGQHKGASVGDTDTATKPIACQRRTTCCKGPK